MIKLIGEKLRQYDLNRSVELIPKHGHEVEEVLFHKNSPEALAVAIREENGMIVASIPNILLKTFGTMAVECHYVDEHGHRISETMNFYVSKRAMPDGYVYEETPVLTLGSGGECDWNKMKNKPFYSEFSNECILPETTVAFSDDGEGMFDSAPTLTAGYEYTVNWNGTEYKRVAQTVEEDGAQVGVAIGDLCLLSGGASTGEPFVILVVDPSLVATIGGTNMCMALDGSASAVISIYRDEEVIYPIDPKYLPFTCAEGVSF